MKWYNYVVNNYLLFFFCLDLIIIEKIDLGFVISVIVFNVVEILIKVKEIVKFVIKKYGIGDIWYILIIYVSDVNEVFSF